MQEREKSEKHSQTARLIGFTYTAGYVCANTGNIVHSKDMLYTRTDRKNGNHGRRGAIPPAGSVSTGEREVNFK